MLDLICPAAPAMSKRVGGFVAGFPADVRKHPGSLSVFEIGCGSAVRPGAAPAGSQDLVASAYTVHNFLETYRDQVLNEIFRVLRPSGIFVNGDRYALDDTAAHTRLMQDDVRRYFKVFSSINRFDLLEQWVLHLFGDESADTSCASARR